MSIIYLIKLPNLEKSVLFLFNYIYINMAKMRIDIYFNNFYWNKNDTYYSIVIGACTM